MLKLKKKAKFGIINICLLNLYKLGECLMNNMLVGIKDLNFSVFTIVFGVIIVLLRNCILYNFSQTS